MIRVLGLCTFMALCTVVCFAQTQVFVGKGMFIEDVSGAINTCVAPGPAIAVPDASEADYRNGLNLLVEDLVNHNVQWVAVKACQGDKPMEQYSAALADAFANAANAGGNANLLPKLAGYHILVASSDVDIINSQIDAEAAAARGVIRLKPVGANAPAGWVIMPSDNYYASAKMNGPSQVEKEASVERYLRGIEKAVGEQQFKLAYSAPLGSTDPLNPNDKEPHPVAHPNTASIKPNYYKRDRFFIRKKFESVEFTGTHNKMVTVAIPRVFWGNGNVPDFAVGGTLHAALVQWVNPGNEWTTVIPLGQVDETPGNITAFKQFVARIPDPRHKINGYMALWDYENATEQQRVDFMAP